MTLELFKRDPYVFNFEAEIVSIDGDDVILDATAFYPGGGGQVCDIGMLREFEVTEVMRKGSDIIHKVPKNNFKKGEKVWGSVDWDRRYNLMKGHTAEHLLFGSLKRFSPDVEIVKIFISPESKYVVVDRDIPWEAIRDAVRFANTVISQNHTVRRVVMDRNDPEMSNVRVDLDKVKSDEVSVTEIGDVDAAACSGIHVMETEEIGMIFVDRKVSAGKDGVAIHFRIGWDAVHAAAEFGNVCLQTCDVLGSKPEDLPKTASNVKEQTESMKSSVKALLADALRNAENEEIDGIKVFFGIFPQGDGKIFTDASESFRSSGSVSILISAGQQATVYVASGSDKVDSGKVLKSILEKYGGRGGGKKEMAQGGIPNANDSKALLSDLLTEIRNILS